MTRSKKAALRRRRLFLERLENRDLLAGNVSASVRGGDLVLRGDGAANQILLERTGNEVTITSLDGETTINGQEGPVVLSRVRDDFRINMGGGSDVLQFANAADEVFRISGNLNIITGSGSDEISFSNVVCHSASGITPRSSLCSSACCSSARRRVISAASSGLADVLTTSESR